MRLIPASLARACLVTALVSASPRAHAHPDTTRTPVVDVTKQAQELLDAGIAYFKSDDLERARVALDSVIALVPDKPNPYRWLGFVESRAGRCGPALAAFETFLSRVPVGDPRTVEVITLRDRCRAELAPKVGMLAVASIPPGAEVRLDEVGDPFLGKTPLASTKLPAGSHVLALHKAGYIDTTRGVTIVENSTLRIDLVLQKVPAPTEHRRRYWIIGAVLGPLAAVGLGVGLGVGLTRSSEHTLPAIMGQ
ncbi:MAG: PEGA domain-containing protein [Polyangia bacterium]